MYRKFCVIFPNFSPTQSRSVYDPTGGGRVVRWSWINFHCRGVLLVWMIVGQGPIALAVGAGGGCLDIFSLLYLFFPLSPSLWETARYRLKYCLKGPLNPKQQQQQHYDPTGTVLAILYRVVSHMLPAKYQPYRPGGSGVEVI